MEWLAVIVLVEAPPNWYAGMDVVPQSNSQVRICVGVDLTKLNEIIYQERHMFPGVDQQTLTQIAWAWVMLNLIP